MNDHFGSSVSALEKIKISEIKRIWVNPIEIFIEFKEVTHIENKKLLQEYHTQADENRAVETAILIMHLADCASILLFWKWIQCVCSTREFSVGEYIKLKSFQKYLDFFFQPYTSAILLSSCALSLNQFSHFAASYYCSYLPGLCWTPIFHLTFPLRLTSLVQLVIDFLLYLYNNQLFSTFDPLCAFCLFFLTRKAKS